MRPFLLMFMCFFYLSFSAQKKIQLSIRGEGYQHIMRGEKTNFKDSIGVINYINRIQYKAISKGYLLASVDSIKFIENNAFASLYVGPEFGKIILTVSQEDLSTIRKFYRVKENLILNLPFRPKELASLMKSLNESLVNDGFPFSRVYLSDIKYEGVNLSGKLNINKGSHYNWSKVHVKGDSSISSTLISSIIQIKKGDTYNESLLNSISDYIKQSNYLQEIKPAEVLFTKEGAELFLYLRSVPVSSINGIIGLQPNPVTERLSVTGELSLKLINVLHHGEMLQLNWRSIQSGTQSFNAGVNYPFLFKSPFGIDLNFQLYKRDSTFLETKSNVGIQYFLNKGLILKAFYQNHTSSILSSSGLLPSYSGIRNNAYGLSLTKRQLDYLPNPSRGYYLSFENALGNRTSTNADSISVKNTTFRSSLKFQLFIPLTKRNILKIGIDGDNYYAPVVYTNELFRFGGLNTLRGFNEEEIFASTKVITSIEYRFLTDKNSHFFIFYDQSVYENISAKYIRDTPFGFGTGFSFGTQLGIFSISYALGKQFDNPILLKNGKIHFGYIAYF